MQIYVQDGKFMDFIASADVTSGQPLVLGAMVGVVTGSAKTGETAVLCTAGVVKVAKTTGQSWAQGAKVYYDSTAGSFTTTATNNTLFGYAGQPALSADTVGQIWISN